MCSWAGIADVDAVGTGSHDVLDEGTIRVGAEARLEGLRFQDEGDLRRGICGETVTGWAAPRGGIHRGVMVSGLGIVCRCGA